MLDQLDTLVLSKLQTQYYKDPATRDFLLIYSAIIVLKFVLRNDECFYIYKK
jgi:hypothetical protein